MGESSGYFFEFGEFQLHPVERQLLIAGKVIPLTPKAFDTLCILVENNGHLLEKNRLMELLWADAFVEEGNLADNISKIRQALGDSRKEPRFIETVSGRGYRFIADVRRREAEAEERSLAKSETLIPRANKIGDKLVRTPAIEQVDDNGPVGPRDGISSAYIGPRRSPAMILVVTMAVIVAAGLAIYFWNIGSFRPSADAAPARSIAVLPFRPLVAGDRDESLELGMSDSLISGLSRLSQINVRPISAVRQYTSLDQDAITAGRDLRVDSVLDGNIRRTGERIRVSARLVRVDDGSVLWSETFDEKFTDIFAVQDSISQKIVAALALQLNADERKELVKKYTGNTEAYQLYLKGRFFWSKLTPDGLNKSLDFYSQAIEIDPLYALAYAGLADSYNLLGSYGMLPMSQSHPRARAAAEKALELDSELAEAHASLAAVIADYYWDWAEADKHFKRAIAINANYPLARSWYSQQLARMGRLDESINEAKLAQALDPLSSSTSAHVGLALYRARRFDEAAAELQKIIAFDPKAVDAHIILGFVFVQQQKGDKAVAEFRTVVEITEQSPSLIALLGYGYAMSGKHAQAKAILKKLESETPTVSEFEKAMIYIGLSDPDKAFESLEKAFNERAWQLGFLKVEPIFDPLRSDERFADLMRRLNL
ncbi:MAG: winged helix-turn-helix domain-containing protein [Pyrinomonadaceae bacterium]